MSECHICGRSTTYGNEPTCECDEDMESLKRIQRESIDALVAHRARIAELEAAVWAWALSSNKQDADQKLLDFITPKP